MTLNYTPRILINEKLTTPEERRRAAALSPAERQNIIDHLLVRYPTFKDAYGFVKSQHYPVGGGTHGKGIIFGLLGISNAGKSFVLESYARDAAKEMVVNSSRQKTILYVNLTKGCSPLNLASAVLASAGLPVPNLGVNLMTSKAIEMITAKDSLVELVVIDDAQYLVCSRNYRQRDQTLGFILGLVKAKTCNVALGGTDDMFPTIKAYPHVYNQGLFPHHNMTPYDWKNPGQQEDFIRMLHAIDMRLPFLELSELADPYIAISLYRASQGAIGSVMQYVKAAAFMAINRGLNRITIEEFRVAAEERADPNDPISLFYDDLDKEDPLLGLPSVNGSGPRPAVSLTKQRKVAAKAIAAE